MPFHFHILRTYALTPLVMKANKPDDFSKKSLKIPLSM